jgi:N-acyl-D-aspartate/D-glutamate deacylase/dipeptidyl aminopeptidase/acylaminoacyl peptidase
MKLIRSLAPLLACLLLAQTIGFSRQSAPGFTLEQLLSSPFPSDLVAAPSGARIAWLFDAQGRRNLWVAEGPQFQARQLTRYDADDGQEITGLSFTHDGQWLIFVRGGEENQAGEVPNPARDPAGAMQAIYAVSWGDGRVRRLAEGSAPVPSPAGDQIVFDRGGQLWVVSIAEGSEPHPFFVARGSNGAPQWSPDGRLLAFVSNRGTHSFIGIYDPANSTVNYLAPSVDRDSAPRWSPDGKRIAFVRQPARAGQPRSLLEDTPDPWAMMIAEVSAPRRAREVWRSGTALHDSLPRLAGANLLRWGADNHLLFASEQDGWMHLYAVSAAGGQARLLTPGACEVEHVALTSDRREIIYSSNCGDLDRRHLWRVKIAGGQPTAITSGEQIEWSPIITGNGAHLAFFKADARRPAMPHVMPLTGGASRMLAEAALPKDFPATKLVVPQPVIFKAADGMQVHGQLFLPPQAGAGEKLPAVVFMHGGPIRQMLLGWHYLYYYHNTYAFNQYLASRGYAVLSVNFRSGVGYGRAFREAPKRGARGASEYQDIVAAAHYLRGRAEIDPARIGLWGGSYGGYLTALGLARNSDLFAAGVDIHGVHDWSARISTAPWIDYGNQDARRIAFEASPVASVAKWRSPVLLVHGDDDRNVAFAQTVDLARRLREQKVTFEQLVFPDEVHDFLLHRHWLEIFATAADFFDRHLKQARPASQVGKVDILIRGGQVLDGSGAAAIRADVGITGDRIAFIGDAAQAGLTAERTLDAAGLIVAPGFIDPHTHTFDDLSHAQRKSNENFLMQGVTTVITGNDGGGPVRVAEVFARWQQQGIGTNAALLAGHGTARRQVMGMSDAAPSPEQLAHLKALIRQAMEEGALGLSTGLYYSPGSFAKTEEVIELAKVAAERGGIYDSHMRDESSYTIGLLGSIAETIRIGREAKIPVHIAHIKALGTDVWGKSAEAIALIGKARAEGIEVTADQYPYTASGTGLVAALVPRWAEVGGQAELRKRIDDPQVRPRLMAEMEVNLQRRGGPESLLLRSARDRQLIGKRLSEIARQWNKTPIEAALEIIKAGEASVVSFNMNEKDIENFMRQPWVMTGSDGSGGHPRKYGTYPRKLREYVFNRQVITLPVAIRASSALVAEAFRIPERGRIAAGHFADVIVFDEQTIADRATYEQPELLAVGMKYVIVNGRLAVDNGQYNGTLAGRPLPKPSAAKEKATTDGRR